MQPSRAPAGVALSGPVYVRVAQELRQWLADEALLPGDAVPPEPVLSARFGISRMTLRRAVELLVHDGLLVRHQGVGTFVAAPRLTEPLIGLHSTRDIAQALSVDHDVRIVALGTRQANSREAALLDTPVGSSVVRFDRVDRIAGVPICVARCSLPAQVLPGVTREALEASSTYELIERSTGRRLTRAKQRIRADVAAPSVAGLLEIRPDAPILVFERLTYDDSGRPVEWGVVSYRHDRMECTVDLERQLGKVQETQTPLALRYQPRSHRHTQNASSRRHRPAPR